ncbi:MAG: hypothetical protein F4137_16500 [Acidobacteria bacterium]|nr:hypothetical protein [Acidobacteriota bacterium]
MLNEPSDAAERTNPVGMNVRAGKTERVLGFCTVANLSTGRGFASDQQACMLSADRRRLLNPNGEGNTINT